MRMYWPKRLTSLAVTLALCLPVLSCAESSAPAATDSEPYSYGQASRDGIGKFYMGREISFVMGHLAAGWLERPSRIREERTDLLIDNLEIKPTDTVVDLGAGTGYFSFPMAEKTPQGIVLAVDIQPEMLGFIEKKAKEINVNNVIPVLATETNPNLPASSVDMALFVDAYHEFSHPYEVMSEVVKSLKPGGRVILVEYRGEDPMVPIKPLHKMTEAQARKEMAAVGLRFVENKTFLPQQHFMVFEK